MVMLDDVFTPANRMVVGLLRSPVGSVLGRGLMVLEYEGRSSGRRYTTPVGYQRLGDDLVVLLSKPKDKRWWRNFREPWPAEILVRRRRLEVTGEVIAPGTSEFYDAIETTFRQLPWMGSQFGGVKYDKATGLTDAQRAVLSEHAAVVRFSPS